MYTSENAAITPQTATFACYLILISRNHAAVVTWLRAWQPWVRGCSVCCSPCCPLHDHTPAGARVLHQVPVCSAGATAVATASSTGGSASSQAVAQVRGAPAALACSPGMPTCIACLEAATQQHDSWHSCRVASECKCQCAAEHTCNSACVTFQLTRSAANVAW
jgi:hypothetical protein